jgi:hypothetical protein
MSTSLPAPAEDADLVPTTTYPHLVVRINVIDYRCVNIGVSVGDWPVGQIAHQQSFVIHPEAFSADGTLSAVCRRFLIGIVQSAVSAWNKQMLILWSPTSCTHVEGESSTEDTTPIEHLCREMTHADVPGSPAGLLIIAATYRGRQRNPQPVSSGNHANGTPKGG